MSEATLHGRPARAPAWRLRLTGAGQAHGALVALAVLVLLNLFFTPNFASAANLWNLLLQVAATVLVAVGMTLVIACGGIDLSVGSIMAVASVVGVAALGGGAAAAVAAGLAAGVTLGLVNGTLITRFGVQPFIATLALMIAGRGAAQVINNGGELIPFTDPAFEAVGRGYVGPVPVPVLLAAAAVALAAFVLRATSLGRYLLAVGGNEAAARVAGVRVRATRLAAYAASGLLAGLAGVIETARLGAADPSNVGAGMEFAAIAAVVMGGTPFSGGGANVFGTVVGALIMVVIAAGLNMHLVPYAWALVLQAAIILLAVYVQRPRLV